MKKLILIFAVLFSLPSCGQVPGIGGMVPIGESAPAVNNDFITQWNLPAGDFTLPILNGTYNFTVDWGDGSEPSSVISASDPNATHTYTSAGTYDITISGTCQGWRLNNNSPYTTELIAVINWGDIDLSSNYAQGFLYGAVNLTSIPDGAQTGVSEVTSIVSWIRNTGLTSLPDNFFENFTNVTSASNVVCQNNYLENIPSMKYLTSCTSFYFAFYANPLAHYGSDLFCDPGDEDTRFYNQTVDFRYCFYRTSYTGLQCTAPDIWNWDFGTGSATHNTATFGNTTGSNATTISNYADIPTGWHY